MQEKLKKVENFSTYFDIKVIIKERKFLLIEKKIVNLWFEIGNIIDSIL